MSRNGLYPNVLTSKNEEIFIFTNILQIQFFQMHILTYQVHKKRSYSAVSIKKDKYVLKTNDDSYLSIRIIVSSV